MKYSERMDTYINDTNKEICDKHERIAELEAKSIANDIEALKLILGLTTEIKELNSQVYDLEKERSRLFIENRDLKCAQR